MGAMRPAACSRISNEINLDISLAGAKSDAGQFNKE